MSLKELPLLRSSRFFVLSIVTHKARFRAGAGCSATPPEDGASHRRAISVPTTSASSQTVATGTPTASRDRGLSRDAMRGRGVARASSPPPHPTPIDAVVRAALDEDVGDVGDVSSSSTIPADAVDSDAPRQGGRHAFAKEHLTASSSRRWTRAEVEWMKRDGDRIERVKSSCASPGTREASRACGASGA